MENTVEWLACSCCGKGIRDNAEDNVSYGVTPYPHDNGVGMCRECGGDDRVSAKPSKKKKVVTEAQARKRLGWAACAFYDARIAMLLEKLNPANRAKFEAMSYVQKVSVVVKLCEKGAIV